MVFHLSDGGSCCNFLVRTLWSCHYMGKRPGNMHIDAFYESPISLCFFCHMRYYNTTRRFESDRRQSLFLPLFYQNACLHWSRHKIESIIIWNFILRIEKRWKMYTFAWIKWRRGFVLPIFRSASEDATPTPRGEKEFGVEFNNEHWDWIFNKILKLRSLPLSSALCYILFRLGSNLKQLSILSHL